MTQIKAGKIKPRKIKGKINKGDCPLIVNIDGGNDPAAIPDQINGYLNGGNLNG